MVQRYNVYGYDVEMEADTDGEYVRYEDYERLKELMDRFFSCAEYSIDAGNILCRDPRNELSEILGYRV